MKQCKANPWEEFAQREARRQGQGPVKSITDFGVFVGLAAGIDGLVHLSDLSWNEPAKPPCATTRRARKSRPSCWPSTSSASASSAWASNAADGDPFTTFTTVHDRGAIVTGKVKTVDARRRDPPEREDVTGYLRASEISRDRVETPATC